MISITEKCCVLLNKLEEQLKENPDDVDLLIQKGFLCLDAFEDDEMAFPPLDRAIQIDPKNVDALFWRAYADLALLGDDVKRRELLEKALSIDPDRADCNSIISTVFRDSDPHKSIHYLEKALKQEPTWIYVRIKLVDEFLRCCDFIAVKETLLDGLKIYKKFELPKSASRMEWYYEDYVTGRVHYTDWHLKDWLERVDAEEKRVRAIVSKFILKFVLAICAAIFLWQLIKWAVFT
ncbi:tetratricopeptide repeat protein [Candidatus Dependentiae bacterium]